MFSSSDEFKRWLDKEKAFWTWDPAVRNKDRAAHEILDHIHVRLNDLQEHFNRALRNADNEQNFRHDLEALKRQLEMYYREQQLLHSSDPRAQLVHKIKENDSVNAAYVLRYFIDRDFNVSHPAARFKAGVTASLYELGLKAKTLGESESLQGLRYEWQEHLVDSKAKLETAEKDFKELLLHLKADRESQAHVFNEMADACKAAHSTLLSSTKENLEQLINLYKTELGLQAPIKYWEAKGKVHRNFVLWLAGAVLIAFGFAAWGFEKSITTFVGQQTIQTIKLSELGILILGATIGVWVIRILIRLLLSNYHLMSDAQERRTMLLTFLALQQENKLPKGETLELILQALFRPTASGVIKDDAIPPFLAEWLRRTTGHD